MNKILPTKLSQRIVQLSQELKRDFYSLSVEYALECLVSRLTQDKKLFKHLIFKGGYVMLKAYDSGRSTIDLDTTLKNISIIEAEKLAINAAQGFKDDGLWIGSVQAEDLEHQTKYHGRRLTFRFSIGEPKVAADRLGKIILDIGTGDVMAINPIEDELEPILGGDPISWSIYPIEVIIAEKLHALIAHGAANSRAKDVYDLTVLIPKVDKFSLLQKAIRSTFENRGTDVPDSFFSFWKDLDKTMLRRASGAILLSSGEKIQFDQIEKELLKMFKKNGL